MKNGLRERILSGETVLGTFCKLNSLAAVEILGLAGMDFIVADCEHSPIGYESVENIIRAGENVGLETIVRVPSADEEHIFHALDSGASGVQIPNLATAAQCADVVKAAKYFPLGSRGLSRQTRAAGYGMSDGDGGSYVEAANARCVVVVHIENKEMADAAEEICKLPQVDVLFIGPADLSQSLGVPGEVGSPKVVELASRVIETANRCGKCAGIHVSSQAAAERYAALGARYIMYGADTSMLAKGVRDLVQGLGPLRSRDAG